MGIFDFLGINKNKNSEPDYDPTDMKLYDMTSGSVFDYDLRNWVVTRTFEYQWDETDYSLEFEIDNGTEIKHLEVEQGDNGLNLTLSEKIKIRMIDEDLPSFIQRNDAPPKNLKYLDEHFFYKSKSVGLCKQEGTDVVDEFINWDFINKDETKILSIEQWGEDEFEAYISVKVKEYEFSNILPGK